MTYDEWRESYCSEPLFNEAMARAAWEAATAKEREACAQVCEDAAIKLFCGKSRVNQIDRHTAEVLRGKAATIRARKES